MIKVAAVDLDGTLLRSDGTVSPATVATIGRVVNSGVRVVIVTARPPRFVVKLAMDVGLTGQAVCANGAIVLDLDTAETTICGPLSIHVARQAAHCIAAVLPGAAFAIETGGHCVVGPGYEHRATREDARTEVQTLDELWTGTDTCVKLLAWSRTPVTDALLDVVARALPAEATLTYSGAPGMLEIQAAGVSKLATLAELCARWGVAAAEVAAFGDMPNDLPLLRWAGLSVAVANAHPGLLAVADEVTASNDEDGVARVFMRWEK
jgi:Cof subfamily protein (haloacid dehalogenase superfamily)